MANKRDNVSETFKLQIFEAISTIRKSRKRPDGKAIQEYINNSCAGNINESFVLDSLRSNRVTDSYFELVLKSLKDHIVSLENQLRNKQYIIEELLKKLSKLF